jgi:hypothetical protein
MPSSQFTNRRRGGAVIATPRKISGRCGKLRGQIRAAEEDAAKPLVFRSSRLFVAGILFANPAGD